MPQYHLIRMSYLLVVSLLLVWVPGTAAARSYVGGTIYTRDGRQFNVTRFLQPLRKDDLIVGREAEKTVSIPVGEALELNLLTSEVNYVYQHSKYVPQTGILTLLLRNGEVRMLSDAYFDRGSLSYTLPDTGQTLKEQKIKLRDIIKIRFEKSIGQVRSCPLDQAKFPDSYLFCPYHGVPLIWSAP